MDFFSTCDHIRSFLRIWSHWLKESLLENFIFCVVIDQKMILGLPHDFFVFTDHRLDFLHL